VVTRRDIWTREQCDVFLTAAEGDPFYAFFVVALTAGMRPGEVMALHWQDMDMEKRQIHGPLERHRRVRGARAGGAQDRARPADHRHPDQDRRGPGRAPPRPGPGR
jgi:integrase